MLFMYLLRGLVRFLLLWVGSLKVTGRENIPATGPYIIAVNHLSKADPPILLLAFPPMRLRYFAAEKWEKHWFFGPILAWSGAVFINRGEVDRRALGQAVEVLKEGGIFGLAPEGTRSRVGSLIQAKEGVAYLASRAKVPILPVGVVNTDRVGHNFSHLRRTRLEAHIGKPFLLPELADGRRAKGADLTAYTNYIMAHIAALIPERYYGYYKDSPAVQARLRGEDPWPYCQTARVGEEVTN
ncbi:MAG: lysophospholipid acyltransferase family protein [Chloroflexota bacterium]